jgi:multimeric flavodoxin WrbA
VSDAKVVIVFHSVSGRTRALAEACARGATDAGVECAIVPVESATTPLAQAALAAADAIVFGCPTYMGSVSAAFKGFMDATVAVWALQGWRDKLAAGFTHSGAPSGDKLGTLTQLAVFAAQHGMIWIGLGLPPTYAIPEARAGASDTNRLGSHLGAMAQSRPGGGEADPSDLRTAEHLGRRVAEAATRWRNGAHPSAKSDDARHATAATWQFPPSDRPPLAAPLERASLREIAARSDRFEHWLMPCAVIGESQLEVVTASEPLAFGHVAVSDEYAIALPTGDDLVDGFPLRTFLADAETNADVGRYNHRSGDVVLHPFGLLHWPGRLRPPYATMEIPSGMRRTGLMLVYCANVATRPSDRPLGAGARAADAKAYVDPAPPMLLRSIFGEPGTVARVGRTSLEIVVRPEAIAPPCGGFALVLEAAAGSPHAACDLVRIPKGARLDGAGIARALVFSSADVAPDASPPVWRASPAPPFAPFEEARPGELPYSDAGVAAEPTSDAAVRITVRGTSTEVPRHWLARMLFRCALHGLRLGRVETYGGFFIDDGGGGDARVRIGVRGGDAVEMSRDDALAWIERFYRAVAPSGYRERLDS